MLKLCNFSTYCVDLDHINHDGKVLQHFLRAHSMDGVELLIDKPGDEQLIPAPLITGVHLKYWGNWLDLWRGDIEELLRQFGSEAAIIKYYGGTTRDRLIASYRAEIKTAMAAGAKYAVFHISNARLYEVFTYKFAYSDEAVINAAIELINEVMNGLDTDITLLLENLWWPGLTLLDGALAAKLLEDIRYPRTGLMVDIGHLMNTNHRLRTQGQATEYVLAVLKNLGDLKQHIQGLHLHHSLSGQYVQQCLAGGYCSTDKRNIMEHILKIDQHLPFDHKEARKIVEYIAPKYLVYEFLFSNIEEWSRHITTQHKALGFIR